MTPPLPESRITRVRHPSRAVLALYYVQMQLVFRSLFASGRIANVERFPQQTGPLIIYGNHPSIWDSSIGLLLQQRFAPGRDLFAPVAFEAFRRHRILSLLGFFPVDIGTVSGTRQFLHDCESVLQDPSAILWITPEGKFTDPRQRPLELRRGLATLVSQLGSVTILPLAIEFAFWEHHRPHILCNWGQPIHIADGTAKTPNEWQATLRAALTETLDELAALSVTREAHRFSILFTGKLGLRTLLRILRAVPGLWRRPAPASEVSESVARHVPTSEHLHT